MNEYKAVRIVKGILLGIMLTLICIYLMFMCSVASHQSIVANKTLCQIAQFSDFMLYGDNVDNWVGTKNLTEGVVMIKDETDTIYAAYNDVFNSQKYDWQWVKDFIN